MFSFLQDDEQKVEKKESDNESVKDAWDAESEEELEPPPKPEPVTPVKGKETVNEKSKDVRVLSKFK